MSLSKSSASTSLAPRTRRSPSAGQQAHVWYRNDCPRRVAQGQSKSGASIGQLPAAFFSLWAALLLHATGFIGRRNASVRFRLHDSSEPSWNASSRCNSGCRMAMTPALVAVPATGPEAAALGPGGGRGGYLRPSSYSLHPRAIGSGTTPSSAVGRHQRQGTPVVLGLSQRIEQADRVVFSGQNMSRGDLGDLADWHPRLSDSRTHLVPVLPEAPMMATFMEFSGFCFGCSSISFSSPTLSSGVAFARSPAPFACALSLHSGAKELNPVPAG